MKSLILLGLLACLWPDPLIFAKPQNANHQVIEKRVPSEFRGKTLRIDGFEFPLDQPTVAYPERLSSGRIELVDKDNRIIGDTYSLRENDSFSVLRKRPFHLSAEAGMLSEAGGKLSGLKLGRISGFMAALNLIYQPSAFGLEISREDFHWSPYLATTPRGRLAGYRYGLGFNYETAPFKFGKPFIRRVHISYMLGATYGEYRARIEEDDVSVNGEDTNFGLKTSVEVRMPMPFHLSWFLKGGYQLYELEIEELYFKEYINELSIVGGFRYAL